MGKSVEEVEATYSAQEILRWMAFFAVRDEKAAEARQRREDGDDDDDVTEWGEEPEDDE